MLNLLSERELQRYARQIVLDEVGLSGQMKLKEASVLVVGAGGLGSPLAMYLAAAGIGHLGLVDCDTVDRSNLHRQLLHATESVGTHKLRSARRMLSDINPHTRLDTYPVRLTRSNALALVERYDIVADGTDNFPTRYLVNDACVLASKPNVYGSVYQFEGQVTVFGHESGPCYRCLFPEPPTAGLVPSCEEGGVLGVLPGIIGLMQANEVIKLILDVGQPLIGHLLLFNALDAAWQQVRLRHDPDCPVCGTDPTVTELIDYETFCGIAPEVTPETLMCWRKTDRPHILLDVRRPDEHAQAHMDPDRLIPVDTLSSQLNLLPQDRDTPIVVHCQTGARSQRAAQMLRETGYTQVFSLAGGLAAWQRAGGQSSP